MSVKDERPSIYVRIDCALEKARWRGLILRGIYLDKADYAAFANARTVEWRRQFGGKAKVWPLSYENALILSKSVLPVKEARQSAVYSTTGEGIAIAKRLSPRVKAAA